MWQGIGRHHIPVPSSRYGDPAISMTLWSAVVLAGHGLIISYDNPDEPPVERIKTVHVNEVKVSTTKPWERHNRLGIETSTWVHHIIWM